MAYTRVARGGARPPTRRATLGRRYGVAGGVILGGAALVVSPPLHQPSPVAGAAVLLGALIVPWGPAPWPPALAEIPPRAATPGSGPG